MARNKRKEERGNGASKETKKRKFNNPVDTNLDILPATISTVNADSSRQMVAAQTKLSGKKRKRLDKYIENKLRKEEAAAIIKKLAERTVDTSSLRSTKTLGQSGKSKPREGRKDWHRQAEDPEDNPRKSTDDEYSNDGINADDDPTGRKEANHVQSSAVVGVALRAVSGQASADHISIQKRRNTQVKPSWRQRLEEARKKPNDDDSDLSEGSMSSPDDSEFSDWGGLSDAEATNPEVERTNSHFPLLEAEIEDNPSSIKEYSHSSERMHNSLYDGDENANQRAKHFKVWAREQSGLGDLPSNISTLLALPPAAREAVVSSLKKQNPPIIVTKEVTRSRSHFVRVQRNPDIQESRLSLPIIAEEQQIMEILSQHDCLVISGETGSGKTTQIPQFLFEAGYGSPGSERAGMIGITQPRRVAAVSMSSRVAEELGPEHEMRVGYQIRFDANLSAETAIKFMTDGVLLREVSLDLLLSKYSAIVVDEAHERSVNTDVLIGMLSRVVKLRREMSEEKDSTIKPLKLIIMSATMRVTDFTANNRLFPEPPPVINVDARQFPVTIHFNKKTALFDYVDEAFKKVSKMHQRLPPGGILVFLTGQDEIRMLSNKLHERFSTESKNSSRSDKSWNPRVNCSAKNMDVEIEDVDIERYPDNQEAEKMDDSMDSSDESEFDEDQDDDFLRKTISNPLHVLPLFSLLPVAEQLQVFQPPPEGSRLCVVATNIAETSLTIPGIKYVVDCGRVKERVYNKTTGVESFQIGWISKASAAQRAGRAGRTGPGHCYRLYSSTVFERDFQQFCEPEILKSPIEGIVLQMKGMHIDRVVNFPFPTPPDRKSLQQAEKLLEYLGALDKDHRITPLGNSMSAFPLLPRYSKMIILGQQFGNMPYIISIVAGLSVGDPVLTIDELEGFQQRKDDANGQTADEIESEALRSKQRKYEETLDQFSALDPGCDVLRLLCAIGAYECGGASDAFCEANFLRVKTMRDIRRLRIQLCNIVNNQLAGIVAPVEFSPNLAPPSPVQIRTIKQIVTAAYLDHIAIRSDLLESNSPRRNEKNVLRVEYSPLSSLTTHGSTSDPRETFIHPNSALAKLATAPEYIVYSDLRESQNSGRLRLLPLTTVAARDIEPLAKGTQLIQYSKPLNYPPPRLFSENGVMKKEIYVVPRFGIQGRGWELPSIKRIESLLKS